mmetsp:Transcript_118944/g.331840  ORF Transcript_118944/g.331840 Transcript_118944/m.331840 type:complete len:204 (-) Transcript_118944:730-1341(-)
MDMIAGLDTSTARGGGLLPKSIGAARRRVSGAHQRSRATIARPSRLDWRMRRDGLPTVTRGPGVASASMLGAQNLHAHRGAQTPPCLTIVLLVSICGKVDGPTARKPGAVNMGALGAQQRHCSSSQRQRPHLIALQGGLFGKQDGPHPRRHGAAIMVDLGVQRRVHRQPGLPVMPIAHTKGSLALAKYVCSRPLLKTLQGIGT